MNGLKFGLDSELKAQFGTSKYCKNFLTNGLCDSLAKPGNPCPFIHKLERRRDKVIQDDPEFNEYCRTQDNVASDFMSAL